MGSNQLISGLPAIWVKLKAGKTLLRISLRTFKNPLEALQAMRMLLQQRKRIHGNKRDHKIVRSRDKYYWSIYTPGFPSKGFNAVIQREILKAFKKESDTPLLQTLIFSISSRCHYSCEHCFEGDNIQQKEHVTYEDLSGVMIDARQNGIRHMQIGGGEPMLRFEEMIGLMGQANGTMDFWLSTSGYGLSPDHARSLKKAGLTGATISLDHWNKEKHNSFRHHSEAYDWVIKAVKNCNDAGIITNLTLCVTREMANETDLTKYMELARKLEVPFVRFLEARKAGSYAHKDILLRENEQATVLNFYLKMNSHKRYKSYPIIQFPGYHQRKIGCFGAGNRYLHIDAKGDYHGCPFCRGAVGNIREMSLKNATELLQKKGCQQFQTNQYV